jgi:aminoglycoside/choline kinase family phosphotransferase
MLSVQEDFGEDCLLYHPNPYSENLIEATLQQLSLLQHLPINDLPLLEPKDLIKQASLMQSIFLENFLELPRDQNLCDFLENLALSVAAQPQVNCHFDFERRNLFHLDNGEIGIIDFQDLKRGPLGIDLAGFCVDHYLSVDSERINNCCSMLLKLEHFNFSDAELVEMVLMAALQRNARILGVLSNLYLEQQRAFRLPDLEQILKNFIDITSLLNLKEFAVLEDALRLTPAKVAAICKQ